MGLSGRAWDGGRRARRAVRHTICTAFLAEFCARPKVGTVDWDLGPVCDEIMNWLEHRPLGCGGSVMPAQPGTRRLIRDLWDPLGPACEHTRSNVQLDAMHELPGPGRAS